MEHLKWYWPGPKCPEPCEDCDKWKWDDIKQMWYTEMTEEEYKLLIEDF